MTWGPPKTLKQRAGLKPGRKGLGSAPYDHIEQPFADLSKPAPGGEEGEEWDFTDPDDPESNQITPARTKAMTDQVQRGVPIPVAAAAIGIRGDLWNSWCKTAREHKKKRLKGGFEVGQSPYVYFLDRLNQAKAQAESTAVMSWYGAIQYDWKAAMAWAERAAPVRYHLATKLEVASKTGNTVDIAAMPTATLLALAKQQVDTLPALTSGEPEDAEISVDEPDDGE